jgi:PAS domain S-box-containing protein
MSAPAATILLVEDDPVHRFRERYVLESAGYAVDEACDGETALEMLERRAPDAVLLDVGLPGIAGLDVLRAFQELPHAHSVPVLMVTGLDGDAVMETAFELGAYDFITKPLNDAVLLQRVRSMLLVRANQRRLAISEQRLATLLQNLAGHAIYMLDPAGRIASWNAGAQALTGFAGGDVLGRDCRIFSPDGVPPDDSAHAALRLGVRDGAFVREGWRRRLDGSLFFAGESINPMYGDDGELLGFACVMQDRTRERALAEQLHQAQRLEAIGRLTGGVAHDFNNLLGVVIGNIDLCLALGGTVDDVREQLGDALDAALRGAKLTSRLLTFARRQTLSTEVVEPNELVRDLTRLLVLTLGERITFAFEPAEDVWPIEVDRAQFEASILNLTTNARDAMPDGGRFSITTSNRTLAEDAAGDGAPPPGDYVAIDVTDTGTGMPADVLERIFEPFFTTKAVGLGTGLGLSMVFGFAAQSGGCVRVRSAPGAGTTFTLLFPRSHASVSKHTAVEDETAETHAPDHEAVLAVDDDPAVLRVLRRELEALGYEVVTAVNADEALAVLEREDIDAMVTDVVMPGGIDGIDLVEIVRERKPDVRIVLASGFVATRPDEAEARFGRLPRDVAFLRKPYRRAELAAALRGAPPPRDQYERDTVSASE